MKENIADIHKLTFSQEIFIEFLTRAQAGSLMENQLKMIMNEMLSTGKHPKEIIEEKGFDAAVIDDNEIEALAGQILAENQAIVEQYK